MEREIRVFSSFAEADRADEERKAMDEEKFEEIANEAIESAESVECTLPEFRDGLKRVIALLTRRFEQVRSECGDD